MRGPARDSLAWTLLLLALPGQFLAFYVPFLPWLLTPAGLLLLRADARWHRGVMPALLAWAAALLAALLGVGITVGVAGDTVVSGGGLGSDVSGLAIGIFLIAAAPLAVVLAMGSRAWAHTLAAGALTAIALTFAIGPFLPSGNMSFTRAVATSALIGRLLLVTYALLGAALVLAWRQGAREPPRAGASAAG